MNRDISSIISFFAAMLINAIKELWTRPTQSVVMDNEMVLSTIITE